LDLLKGTYRSISLLQLLGIILLGVVCTYATPLISLCWLVVVCVSVYAVIKDDIQWLWYGIAASPSLEVWARMSRSPLIPYEIGKYYLVAAIVLLLIHYSQRNIDKPVYKTGIYLLLILLPSIIVGIGDFDFESWVMNLLGIVELAVLLIFMAYERWTVDAFCKVLQAAFLPIIGILIYLTLKTPNFDEINFSLSSNFKTSGDFGSNQVSTIIGLGMVLLILLMILRRPFLKVKWLNYLLLAVLLFRGFLTFSRGGMLTALLSIFIALLPAMFASARTFVRYALLIVLLGGLSFVIFNKVNDLTGNQLLLRYKGETAGTLAGTKERNLNTLTSYRFAIIMTDLRMFKQNVLFGVGPGVSKDLRPQYGFESIAPHTEYTRLLAEHGIGGLIVVVILTVFPVWWVRKQKLATWKAVSAALFVYAIVTSTHSAMRTNTTVVCYVLAAVPVFFYIGKGIKKETVAS